MLKLVFNVNFVSSSDFRKKIVSRTRKFSLKTVLDKFFVAFYYTKNTRTDVVLVTTLSNSHNPRHFDCEAYREANSIHENQKNMSELLFLISLLFNFLPKLQNNNSRMFLLQN